MCFEDSCIPYSARPPATWSRLAETAATPSTESNAPAEEIGGMCVNVEYDVYYPNDVVFRLSRGDVVEVVVPRPHEEHRYRKVCVDVYQGDSLSAAKGRLNKLLETRSDKEGWKNESYYCINGLTRLFMSIFRSGSLDLSDKYCGKT